MIALKPAARAAVLALAVAVSMSFARTVRAAEASFEKMPSSYAALMKMKPMDVMHMMDKDKKGVVTKEQFMKFHEAMFDNMDKNKDGQLSREEWLGQIHSSP
jgi:Ca2+-binding EF-hand superfamily protein